MALEVSEQHALDIEISLIWHSLCGTAAGSVGLVGGAGLAAAGFFSFGMASHRYVAVVTGTNKSKIITDRS